jgi:hypothetical protein
METIMRKFALLGASALVLALGVASASAQPSGQDFLTRGQTSAYQNYAPKASGATAYEGRAAAIETPAPAADAFIWQEHRGR